MTSIPHNLAAPQRPQDASQHAAWRVGLSELDWHLDKLRQIEEAIESVLTSDKFNAAGLAALMTRAKDARKGVDRLLEEQPDALAGMTFHQLAAWASDTLHTWPDEVLEAALGVYATRHQGRVLFESPESGQRAAYDPDGATWVPRSS